MNPLDVSFVLLALLPAAYRAWQGWTHGAAAEVRHLVVNVFGLLVAIRYWQPWTEALAGGLSFDARIVALAAFVLLYALGALVAAFVVRLRAPTYRAVGREPLQQALGVVAGGFSGLLLTGTILWMGTIAAPGKFDDLAPARDLAAWPQAFYQSVERTLAGVPAGSPERTRFPAVTVAPSPIGAPSEAGVVPMRPRGSIRWN